VSNKHIIEEIVCQIGHLPELSIQEIQGLGSEMYLRQLFRVPEFVAYARKRKRRGHPLATNHTSIIKYMKGIRKNVGSINASKILSVKYIT